MIVLIGLFGSGKSMLLCCVNLFEVLEVGVLVVGDVCIDFVLVCWLLCDVVFVVCK